MDRNEFICRAVIAALPKCIELVAQATAYYGQDEGISVHDKASSMAEDYAMSLAHRMDMYIDGHYERMMNKYGEK